MKSILNLNDDVILEILSFLKLKDIYNLFISKKFFYNLEKLNYFWKKVGNREHPFFYIKDKKDQKQIMQNIIEKINITRFIINQDDMFMLKKIRYQIPPFCILYITFVFKCRGELLYLNYELFKFRSYIRYYFLVPLRKAFKIARIITIPGDFSSSN